MPRSTFLNVISPTLLFPQDTIIMFAGTACPDGWSEVTELQGRVPIGEGGVFNKTLGDSLDVTVTTHTHSVSAHSHDWDSTSTGVAYNGACAVAAGGESDASCFHTHGIDAGTTDTTDSDMDAQNYLQNYFGGTWCKKT